MPALQFVVSSSDNKHMPMNRANGYKHNTKVIPNYNFYFCTGLPKSDVVSKYFPFAVCRISMIKHLVSYVFMQNWVIIELLTMGIRQGKNTISSYVTITNNRHVTEVEGVLTCALVRKHTDLYKTGNKHLKCSDD